MKKNVKYALIIISVVIIGGLIYFAYSLNSEPGEYDEFAQCLTENGAVMYGTDWCHFCQNQKELFGRSFEHVNYRNCDSVQQECVNAGVEGYPTWRIGNVNYQGLQTLEKLATLTGCNLQ